MNPDLTPFQRRYVSYVKRCDELERRLRFFSGECGKFNLPLKSGGDVETFLASAAAGQLPNTNFATGKNRKNNIEGGVLDNMEGELEGYETQLKEVRGQAGLFLFFFSRVSLRLPLTHTHTQQQP